MTERVTWETCPMCGGRVAVGWQPTESSPSDAQEVPVEFDCLNGCSLTSEQLAHFTVVPAHPRR